MCVVVVVAVVVVAPADGLREVVGSAPVLAVRWLCVLDFEEECNRARRAAMAVGQRRPMPCERRMEFRWEEKALGQGRL